MSMMINSQLYKITKEEHFRQSVGQIKIFLFAHEFGMIKRQKEARDTIVNKRGDEVRVDGRPDTKGPHRPR